MVAGKRTAIFTNSEFNPHGLLKNHYDDESDDLLSLARRAEKLRRALELPLEGPAHLYLVACEDSSNLSDAHSLGPRRLAERILNDLDAT